MGVINADNGVFAWLNFRPRGNNNTFWDSFNISGYTDHGTGRYTFFFDTDPTHNSYVVAGSGAFGDGSDDANIILCGPRRSNSLNSGSSSHQLSDRCYTAWTYPHAGSPSEFGEGASNACAFIGRR